MLNILGSVGRSRDSRTGTSCSQHPWLLFSLSLFSLLLQASASGRKWGEERGKGQRGGGGGIEW